jgi:cellulose synthase (UDP-forming)
MSHFGSQTGYPALRVTVTGPSNVISEGRDYLVIGTISDQPAFNRLAPILPVTLDDAGIHTKPAHGLSAGIAAYQSVASDRWSSLVGKKTTAGPSSNDLALAGALVEEIESPVSPGRSIVIITLRRELVAEELARELLDPTRPSDTSGSLILLKNSALIPAAKRADLYHVGDITGYARMRLFLTQYFFALLVVAIGLSFLCARYAHAWMAWHANERLKLAATVDDSNASGQATEG